MRSGVFPDIERAIADPGAEIDRSGRYLVHRDFTNSERLNTLLDGGGGAFAVRFRGATYRIDIRSVLPGGAIDTLRRPVLHVGPPSRVHERRP
jgi:hypothetical protein